MAPEKMPEVRIARRVLTALYLVFTFGLCGLTAASIVRALIEDANGKVASPRPAPVPPGGRVLADLRTLFEELRQRGETAGGTNPRRLVDLSRWQAWTTRWRERLERVGARHGLTGGSAEGEVARALQRVYRDLVEMHRSYQESIGHLAAARKTALEGVEAELRGAAQALRAARRMR